MHWLSTTIQLVGTLVTAYGLFYAYSRATGLPARIKEWWARIRREQRDITVEVQPAQISVGMLAPDAIVEFKLTEDAGADEKLAQLESYVRELRRMFGPVNAAIGRLERAIEQAREHANTVAAQAIADAKVELQRFGDRLNQLQAVDLRIAGAGALIMAVGYALSYFSCFRF